MIAATTDDWDTMARTIYGEARGESYVGQVAVAWVIKNRAELHWGGARTIEEVCKAREQFSCWNIGDPNRTKLLLVSMADPTFRRALGIAALVLSGDLPDYSKGATNYINPSSLTVIPDWVSRMIPTATIGNHKFLKEVA